MPIDNQEMSFRYLVTAQNTIGWDHPLKGRLSHHWIQRQQLHLNLNPDIDPSKSSGEQWMQRVLTSLSTALSPVPYPH